MEFHPEDFPWGEPALEITKRVLSDHVSAEPLEGVAAQRVLRVLMNEVESAMSDVCTRHSRFFLLMAVRDNINPDDLASGEPDQSLSLAPLKYWTLAALKYGHDQFVPRALGTWPNDLVRFTSDETRDLFMFLELGHYFSYLTRIWYSVGTGGSIEIRDDGVRLQGDDVSIELRAFHNHRLERNRTSMMSPAAMIGPQPEPPGRRAFHRKMLMTAMVLGGEEGTGEPLTVSHPSIHRGATFTVRYIPQYLDLTSFHDLARPFSASILREYGLSIDELCSCLECLSFVQLEACYKEARHQAGLVATGISTFRFDILRELMRQSIGTCAKHFTVLTSYDSLLRRFFDRMVLGESQLRSLDIHAGWFPSFLFLSGDVVIIDWCAAVYMMPMILQGASSTPDVRNIKGQQFENTLGKWLTTRVPEAQVFFGPNKKLRSDGRVLAEVDLSFRRGNIGYIIDCKAYNAGVELLRGDIDAVNNRWSYAEEWVSECIKRTRILAQRPKGDNYQLNDSVEYLVPLVCSTTVEPVESLEERYLVAPGLPRVCTPLELVDMLGSVSNDALISNSYTFIVEKG